MCRARVRRAPSGVAVKGPATRNPLAGRARPPGGRPKRSLIASTAWSGVITPATLQSAAMPGVLDAFKLDGKVAIVTGASSGLGVAFATGLAGAGADVAICARRVEKLEETRRQVEATG